MDERISMIRESVHHELDFDDYNSTCVKNNTSCYSHAIGTTLTFIDLCRIGAISSEKDISQPYRSAKEVEELLFDDMKVLELSIEKIPDENVELLDNQYVIRLYVKVYRENMGIFDYHFLRMDNNKVWSEKWRYHNVSILSAFDLKRYEDFPWRLVGTYRITK